MEALAKIIRELSKNIGNIKKESPHAHIEKVKSFCACNRNRRGESSKDTAP